MREILRNSLLDPAFGVALYRSRAAVSAKKLQPKDGPEEPRVLKTRASGWMVLKWAGGRLYINRSPGG